MNNNNDLIPYFAGISAFLSIIESLIPTPLPFLRLGIANIPVCIGFKYFQIKQLSFIILFKIIVSHIIRGSLFSYPFLVAITGNILFIVITYPIFLMLEKHISFISVSVIGALSHTIGQLFAALIFFPLDMIFYISILMIPISIISGFITGIISNKIYYIHMEEIIEIIRKPA